MYGVSLNVPILILGRTLLPFPFRRGGLTSLTRLHLVTQVSVLDPDGLFRTPAGTCALGTWFWEATLEDSTRCDRPGPEAGQPPNPGGGSGCGYSFVGVAADQGLCLPDSVWSPFPSLAGEEISRTPQLHF